MSGIVTNPIQFDTVGFSRLSFSGDSGIGQIGRNPGPYQVGNALYVVLQRNDSCLPELNGRVAVWKIEGNGATITAPDSANAPPSPTNFAEQYATAFDPVNKVIHIAYNPTDSPPFGPKQPRIWTFDCNTDSYGGPGATSGTTVQSRGLQLARLSNGDLYLYYNNTTGLRYLKFSGGTWGSPVTITTRDGAPAGVLVDASDNMHVVYKHNASGTLLHLVYVQLDSAGTAGAPTTLDTTGSFASTYACGDPVFWGDNLVFPWAVITAANAVNVSIGTPVSAPTFTTVAMDTGSTTAGATTNSVYNGTALDQDGNLVGFWVVFDASDGDFDRVYMATNSGSGFGSPVLFYDIVTDPPPNAPGYPYQFLHTLSQFCTAAGEWYVVTAIETLDIDDCSSDPTDFRDHCTGFLLTTAALVARKQFPQYIKRFQAPGH